MAVKITYFVHGTTTDNEAGISTGWNGGQLSARGLREARELRSQISDKTFDAVFCSDLARAVDSARLGFEGMAPIIPDARLRECNYGNYNGHPTAIVGPMKQQSVDQPFPGGESYEDVKRRIADFLSFLRDNYQGKHIAIVAHEAPQYALDVLLKGKTWEQAFAEDWRHTKSWQPGWEYVLE